MAGLFDTMKNLTPVTLSGGPPNAAKPPPVPLAAPAWGVGDGQTKLTPETASKSAATVMR